MTATRSLPASPDRGGPSRRVLKSFLRHLEHGQLTVTEGSHVQVFGDDGGIRASLVVHDRSAWRSVLARGGIGLGEAYFEGRWDSPDPVAVLRLLSLNIDRVNQVTAPLTHARRALAGPSRWLRRQSKALDRRNVGAHYDLGNDFFQLFLDPTMAYSAAFFETAEDSLQRASEAKFERICDKLDLGPDDHVLEIGGGWGGFAVHAAAYSGCRVTTTTISARQYEYATQLVADAGLGDRVTVLNQDYRDLSGRYSHLVSIEMIEAVDSRDLGTFFTTCERLLEAGGQIALQCITIADREYQRYNTDTDFIRRYIFPGGNLPSITSLTRTMTQSSNLRVTALEDFGQHYASTLREWRTALNARREEARRLGYGEQFLRMWDFYFAYCEAGFLERRISVIQLVAARPEWRPVPIDQPVAAPAQGS